ncbi:putative membrane protein [Paenibacillus sp. JGP012]|uniref:hypothetical protein n=1 Tax=Paenibacillus sp. JGP012 TaxID=2735914 RepID=UPI0016220EA0|nr:hypothetical protein [Paenibacillus sp. JGP012]MBB6022781.1 putative membrane protein [Paenibacillus sp. JGP012]
MNLRKGFIISLILWIVIGTMLPTAGYALSDSSASMIMSENNGALNTSMEDTVLLEQEYIDDWDPLAGVVTKK